jgi:cytochrome b
MPEEQTDIDASASRMTVKVWDLPTRVGHWLAVVLLLSLWWTAHYHFLDWHSRLGYALLALLIFRVYWGFCGSSTARFDRFLRGPLSVVDYGRKLLGRTMQYDDLGHNPIGGWSVIILLVLMFLQTVVGLFVVDIDGLNSGPLSALVNFDTGRHLARLHHVVFNVLLIFASVHIAAALFYLLCMKQNLIKPMVTGRTDLPKANVDCANSLEFASSLRASLGVVLAVLLTWAIVSL